MDSVGGGGAFRQRSTAEIDAKVAQDAFVVIVGAEAERTGGMGVKFQIVAQPQIGVVEQHRCVAHHINGCAVGLAAGQSELDSAR